MVGENFHTSKSLPELKVFARQRASAQASWERRHPACCI